jgi:O-antigen ligase
VLLDPHNDYLALLSQYGIPLGVFWIYLVFLYPYLNRIRAESINHPYYHLYVINFAMAIAAFSNAGFFKHQVAATLIFCFCITHKLNHEGF